MNWMLYLCWFLVLGGAYRIGTELWAGQDVSTSVLLFAVGVYWLREERKKAALAASQEAATKATQSE